MDYYFAKTLAADFNAAVERAAQALKQAPFGIISEIDVKDTFKKNWESIFGTTAFSVPAIRT